MEVIVWQRRGMKKVGIISTFEECMSRVPWLLLTLVQKITIAGIGGNHKAEIFN